MPADTDTVTAHGPSWWTTTSRWGFFVATRGDLYLAVDKRWLPEPGRMSMHEIRRYQVQRWRQAVEIDAGGELVVLDGDPLKLYYS